MPQTASLKGVRVLVVEDNFFVAEHIRTILEASGCTVVGPVGRLEDGLRLAAEEALDGALLDINLHGDRSFPIADALRERGIPFVFLTGYDSSEVLPTRLLEVQRLGKPVSAFELIATAESTFVH
jgi:CheY-like chemotaxis protein